jgi:hypothetical protein
MYVELCQASPGFGTEQTYVRCALQVHAFLESSSLVIDMLEFFSVLGGNWMALPLLYLFGLCPLQVQ